MQRFQPWDRLWSHISDMHDSWSKHTSRQVLPQQPNHQPSPLPRGVPHRWNKAKMPPL
jgi:hypothetical protein